jgi:hypothetical protein
VPRLCVGAPPFSLAACCARSRMWPQGCRPVIPTAPGHCVAGRATSAPAGATQQLLRLQMRLNRCYERCEWPSGGARRRPRLLVNHLTADLLMTVRGRALLSAQQHPRLLSTQQPLGLRTTLLPLAPAGTQRWPSAADIHRLPCLHMWTVCCQYIDLLPACCLRWFV